MFSTEDVADSAAEGGGGHAAQGADDGRDAGTYAVHGADDAEGAHADGICDEVDSVFLQGLPLRREGEAGGGNADVYILRLLGPEWAFRENEGIADGAAPYRCDGAYHDCT